MLKPFSDKDICCHLAVDLNKITLGRNVQTLQMIGQKKPQNILTLLMRALSSPGVRLL